MIEVIINKIKKLFKENDLKIQTVSNYNNNQGNRGTIFQAGRDIIGNNCKGNSQSISQNNSEGFNIQSSGDIVNDFSGDTLKINGVDYSGLVKKSKEINIVINGNIKNLIVDNCNQITVVGDANEIETTNGNVEITGSVSGNVETINGSVKANQILGKVETVNGNIRGEIK